MLWSQTFALLAASAGLSVALPQLKERDLTILEYEYVVVGSGAGGGPLAARVALAGNKTLLIEAGSDEGDGSNANYAPGAARDETQATYQIPIASNHGNRNGAREFVISVSEAVNDDGSKKYPLDVRLNCFVTKVSFDTSDADCFPRAYGVEFLDGKSLYRVDPRSKDVPSGSGLPGCAHASREVIIAGGSYNSLQILKLSGVGPADELAALGIPLIADLPGVGTNLQDHYEVVVQGSAPINFNTLDGCNFAFGPSGEPIPKTDDPCYNHWLAAGPGGDRGPYASSCFAAAMLIKSPEEISPDENYGLIAFGGPVNFRGYFPGYSYNATDNHNYWSWAILKSHPRNTAGSVTLRSADPLDTPDILYNYFDTGSGDYQKDLDRIAGAIEIARAAIKGQSTNFTEIFPGTQDVDTYVKNTACGHHASSTCAIGTDSDPMAVLDSSFRVRNVQNLRVVDASVYPKIPGTFTAASTYLVAEKAADFILSQLREY